MQLGSSPPVQEAAAARARVHLETLERMSAVLCDAHEGPGALCKAIVDAAAHQFEARWAAMTFVDPPRGLPPAIIRSPEAATGWAGAPQALRGVAARAVANRAPVVVRADDATVAVAVPMPSCGERAGALALGLPLDAQVDESDLSLLITLASHAGLALHDARLSEETLEQERNRIARELHDTVAQHLLSIGMMLEWCRKHESNSSPTMERLVASKELARSALEEIRAVIYELSSTERPQDLPVVLAELVGELTHTTGLGITLRERGRPRALPRPAEHALAQIAREALFNVARHAEASRAWLTVRYDDRSVGLTVADNGRGEPERLQHELERAAHGDSARHRGLANLAERSRELAATIRFAPRRGGGVRLEVSVPR